MKARRFSRAILSIKWSLNDNIGVHGILRKKCWIVCKRYSETFILLPSSRHVPSAVIPVDWDTAVMNFTSSKSISTVQIAQRNGYTLTGSDCFSHVFLLAIVGERSLVAHHMMDHPTEKKFCTRLAQSNASLSWDFVCVLSSSFVPFFNPAAITF